MTYKRLKSLTTGLLAGDTMLPKEPDVLLSLVEMGLDEVVTQADSLRLLTLDRSGEVSRMGRGDYVYRVPVLPETDEAELDIDNELCFPLARFVASYISSKKFAMHRGEAHRLIKMYNSKVNEIMESVKQEGADYDN